MKTYKIPYEFYPFNVEHLQPNFEEVEAESLELAFKIMREKYGEKIEIFEHPARRHYNE